MVAIYLDITAARTHYFTRILRHVCITMNTIKRYDQIYPYIPTGSLLNINTCPEHYKIYLQEAVAESFAPMTSTNQQ